MTISVQYTYAGAVMMDREPERHFVDGDCFDTDFGKAMIILDAPSEGNSAPEFAGVFRLAGPLATLDPSWKKYLKRMIQSDLIHVLEVRESDWVDSALLEFCRELDVGFVGAAITCCTDSECVMDSDLITRFLEPFDDTKSLIQNLKTGNFIVESKSQLYCSAQSAVSLLRTNFQLEANPLFGQKTGEAFMLRLQNSSPFSVLMQLTGSQGVPDREGPFVLRPNGKHLLNVNTQNVENLDTVSDQGKVWEFEWLNVRQFDGAAVRTTLPALGAA